VRFRLPNGSLQGDGRRGLKCGSSRKIREIWQPYRMQQCMAVHIFWKNSRMSYKHWSSCKMTFKRLSAAVICDIIGISWSFFCEGPPGNFFRPCTDHRVHKAFALEVGRMSDYDIRTKPKVWAGSPNECQTFGRSLAECYALG